MFARRRSKSGSGTNVLAKSSATPRQSSARVRLNSDLSSLLGDGKGRAGERSTRQGRAIAGPPCSNHSPTQSEITVTSPQRLLRLRRIPAPQRPQFPNPPLHVLVIKLHPHDPAVQLDRGL